MFLLDTNALIILMYGEVADGKLSKESLDTMATEERLFVSVVSLWEMAIKIKLGKLLIKGVISDIEKKCKDRGIEIIPIKAAHVDETMEMPLLSDHKDPFDRLILATAIAEDLVLISTDERMRKEEYNVKVIW